MMIVSLLSLILRLLSLLRIKCGYTAESVDVREGSRDIRMCVYTCVCVCAWCVGGRIDGLMDGCLLRSKCCMLY